MIYKNIEIHNIAELIDNGDGSVSWLRVPREVADKMELGLASNMVINATGVELRFVIRGESATIRMRCQSDSPLSFNTFHVFRGGIQGGWDDHEVHRHVTSEVQDFVIERSKKRETLRKMTENAGYDWDPEVVRIIFDRGSFKIYDILGDVVPPTREQTPKKTLLSYGSSITHGSNAIDGSHAWVSVLAHNLNMDTRNLGMAGSCAMEPEMAEYIASEGEQGKWDIATLELGINVLGWEESKIRERVENIVRTVAGRNPEKPVFVISPFFHCGELNEGDRGAKIWRELIEEILGTLAYENVTYINGLDILGDCSGISADGVHPNIYGAQQIADRLTEVIRKTIKA